MSEFSPFIDKLRGLLPLSTIVSRALKLQRHGHEFQACCPFHEEKTPSFTVNDHKGFYHCFGCGAHGDILRFMMDHHKLPFMEALHQLASIAGISVPSFKKEKNEHATPYQKRDYTLFAVMEEAACFFEKQLQQSSMGLEYLQKRHFSNEAIKKHRLGLATSALVPYLQSKGFSLQDQVKAGLVIDESYDNAAYKVASENKTVSDSDILKNSQHGKKNDVLPSTPQVSTPHNTTRISKKPYARFRDRLVIPIIDQKNRVIAFGGRSLLSDQQPKYMNSPETELFHKGYVLFGLNHIKNASATHPIIVVEGYFDAIRAIDEGFNAVAPLGTSLTQDQMRVLWRHSYEPILCFDGDRAGHKAMIRAAYNALPLLKPGYSFRFATLPVGEDPDSLISQKGRDFFDQCLKDAKPMVHVLCHHYIKESADGTPEMKARHKQEFLKNLEMIQDKDIQGFYKQAFYEQQALSKKKFSSKKSKTGRENTLLEKKGVTPSINLYPSDEFTQKILLVTLLNHPTLIATVIEHLVQVDFSLEGSTSLVNAIVDTQMAVVGDESDGDMSFFQEKVLSQPLAKTLLMDEALLTMAPFSKKEASHMDAEEGFLNLWHSYTVKANLQRALLEQSLKLKKDWDIHTWNTFKHLQTELYAFSSEKE